MKNDFLEQDAGETTVQERREVRSKPKRPGKPTKYAGILEIDGGYWIRARVTDPKTDKEKERAGAVMGISLDMARTTLAGWRVDLLAPSRAIKPATRLRVCAASFMRFCADQGEARSTLESKAQILDDHVLPYLGDHFIHAIEAEDLERWLSELSSKTKANGDPYAQDTIEGCWWPRFQVFYRWCMVPHGLTVDVTQFVNLRRCLNRELRRKVQASKGPNRLTKEQIAVFLRVARELYPQHFAMIVCGVFTGLRWSELSALRWEHFNRTTWEIDIIQSQYRGTMRARTKTGEERAPSFTHEIWKVLEAHRAQMVKDQAVGLHSGLVFPSRVGKPRYASVLDKPFRRICEVAGISKRLSSKAFRRTFVDLARQAKVDPIIKFAMVGHADDGVHRAYSTVEAEEKQCALGKVIELITGPGKALGDIMGDTNGQSDAAGKVASVSV